MTFNSSVTNHPEVTGSFDYDPVGKTLSANYTLSSGGTLSITSPSCNGNSVSFTIANSTDTYNFHGAYNPPNPNNGARISGNCVSAPTPGGDEDPWVADGI